MRSLISHRFAPLTAVIMAGSLLTGCAASVAEPPAEPSLEPVSSEQPSSASPSPFLSVSDEPVAYTPASEYFQDSDVIRASDDGPAQNVPVPVAPGAIHDPTAEGAEATLRYFWDAYHYSLLTGDTQYTEEMLYHYGCEWCNDRIGRGRTVIDYDVWSGVPPFVVEISDIEYEDSFVQAKIHYTVTSRTIWVFGSDAPLFGSNDSDDGGIGSHDRFRDRYSTLMTFDHSDNTWKVHYGWFEGEDDGEDVGAGMAMV